MDDADVTVWTPQVEQRSHPVGEKGVITSLEAVAERVAKGAVSPKVRMWAIECLDRGRKEQGLKVDNERERAEILLRACQKKLWVPDPIGVEWMAGAHLMACDPEKDGVCFRGNDCFPAGTLLLAEGHEPTPVEKIIPGMRIWGLDRWSEVEAVQYKGCLPIDVITLNNGSEVKLTPDHHVYVLDCQKHPMLDEQEDALALPEDKHWRGGGTDKTRWGCSCDAEHRVEKRCRVSELRDGMVVPTPDRIPFGDETMDRDRAYIEGLYLSDGWADYSKNTCFFISGQDGCPKEEQKQEVQKACVRLGVETTWKRKSISIRDKEWTLRVQQMGRYAPEKHLLSINLDEAAAAPTLRGVMADSGKNTRGPSRTFTTTSRDLAIQTRLLHKMFGIQCGWRYIENHGGLGKNPIYRLGQRGRETTATGRKPWLLKVKSIEREVLSVPCWDIQTDDHRVYLAEHDVTVSQCDDLVILLGSCFSSVGIYTSIVGHAYDREKNISHVLTSAWVNGRWMYADPSTDLPLGECVKFTRERVYSVPNIKVICDANVCFTHPRRFDPEKNDYAGEGSFVGVSGLPPWVRDLDFSPSSEPSTLAGVPKFAWLAAPSREVRWLGQTSAATDAAKTKAVDVLKKKCDQIPSDCAARICRQIVQRGGGYSDSDMRSYTQAAASCGAEAACTYFGAVPPVSKVCGAIGSAIGGLMYDGVKTVVNKIGNLFGRRGNKAKKVAKRIAAVHEMFGEMDDWLDDITADQIEATDLLHQLLDDALARYNEVSPVHNLTKLDLAMKIQEFGLPITTSWSMLLGITVGVQSAGGSSVFSGTGTQRSQAEADELNSRYGMIMAPDWDADFGIFMADTLEWDGVKTSRDAVQFLDTMSPVVAAKYNQVHDRIVDWLAQLEVSSAMLIGYVTEAAAKNAASQALHEAKTLQYVPINFDYDQRPGLPTCKTRQQAEDAQQCLQNPNLAMCVEGTPTLYEYMDALPFCDGVLTQTERDLLALAEAIADQNETAKRKKKSSMLPVLVFASAAAGLAWWAL